MAVLLDLLPRRAGGHAGVLRAAANYAGAGGAGHHHAAAARGAQLRHLRVGADAAAERRPDPGRQVRRVPVVCGDRDVAYDRVSAERCPGRRRQPSYSARLGSGGRRLHRCHPAGSSLLRRRAAGVVGQSQSDRLLHSGTGGVRIPGAGGTGAVRSPQSDGGRHSVPECHGSFSECRTRRARHPGSGLLPQLRGCRPGWRPRGNAGASWLWVSASPR